MKLHVAKAKRGKTGSSDSRLVLVFTSDWMRKWREFFLANHVSQLMQNQLLFFYTQMKTAVFVLTESVNFRTCAYCNGVSCCTFLTDTDAPFSSNSITSLTKLNLNKKKRKSKL